MEQHTKKALNFTQKRLTCFFILVVGTAVFMNIYTVFFSSIYYLRYQSATRQIPVFRTYYETLKQSFQALDDYLVNEDHSDYTLSLQTLEESEKFLSSLLDDVHDAQISREVFDLMDMSSILKEKIISVGAAMDRYHQTGKIAFSTVTQQYQDVLSVHTAILDEYEPFLEMLLDHTETVYQEMQQKSFLGIAVFAVVFLASGMLMFSQIRYIHHSIAGPINELIHAAEQVWLGKFDCALISLKEQSADEGMLLLVKVFNKMVRQVKQQIETLKENARVQKQLQESRFKELQMQINPHFMFNTLNMISDFAYLENAEKTVVLLNKTAKMFRFSLDFSGKTVTLSREIAELHNYIYIQQQRFGKRIHFLLNIDENCPDLKLPALTLQPLVENAITHGVGMLTSNAEIKIETRYESASRTVSLIIQDNGEGMSPSALDHVLNQMYTYTTQNAKIGLGNVYLRLKMFFKDRVRMNIESTEGQGTAVTIEIQYKEEESICTD